MSDALWLLLLTIAIEGAVTLLVCRLARWPWPAAAVVLVNLLTHPLALAFHEEGLVGFFVLEASVLVAETLGYRLAERLSLRRAFALAALANGVTAALSYWI